MGFFVKMVHADVMTGTVPSVSPLFIFIPYIYSSLHCQCQTDPKWSYSSLAPAFRCASPADCRLASPTRWAPWILVRSRRSYAPLGRPAALGLR